MVTSAAEVEVGDAVARHHHERLIPVRHRGLEGAGRAQGLFLDDAGSVEVVEQLPFEDILDQRGHVPQGHAQFGESVLAELLHHVHQHGPVDHGHQRLGALQRQGLQARAFASGHRHDLHVSNPVGGETASKSASRRQDTILPMR